MGISPDQERNYIEIEVRKFLRHLTGHRAVDLGLAPSSDPKRLRLHPRPSTVLGGLLLIAVGVLVRIFVLGAPLYPPSRWPDGTTAQCRDRSFSKSAHHSGTCSFHDGVAYWRYESTPTTER
jgi:hypothetical protein